MRLCWWQSLAHAKTKLKESKSWEEALKIKLTTVDNSVKALQEEVELLKKEFALSKVAAEKMKEKMKIDLNEVEVKILKTHEVGFNKAIRQVKYFFKDADMFLFNVDNNITCQGDLVNEVEMSDIPSSWNCFAG